MPIPDGDFSMYVCVEKCFTCSMHTHALCCSKNTCIHGQTNDPVYKRTHTFTYTCIYSNTCVYHSWKMHAKFACTCALLAATHIASAECISLCLFAALEPEISAFSTLLDIPAILTRSLHPRQISTCLKPLIRRKNCWNPQRHVTPMCTNSAPLLQSKAPETRQINT
jgi:hypothetical protein